MLTSANAMALNSRLSTSHTCWASAAVLQQDGVRGKVASMLGYLVADDEVAHVDVSISGTERTTDIARAAVFTKDKVVVVDINGHAAVTSTVVARDALRSLRLHDVPNLIAGGFGDGSPLRVALDYGSAFEEVTVLQLGHTGQTPRNAQELQDFLPSLVSDIARAHE